MGEVAIEQEKEVCELENRKELESAARSGRPKWKKKGGGGKQIKTGLRESDTPGTENGLGEG